MGTITERKRKNGEVVFFAQVVKKGGGKVHRESQTFERRKAAQVWIEKRERELNEPGGIERARLGDPLLGEVIDRYVAESERALGKTKTQVLRSLKGDAIAEMKCSDIKSNDVIDLARRLRADRKPQTVMSYLSHLAAIFAVAKPAWGVELDQQAMKDAFVVGRRLGVICKGASRERRPSCDEIKAILGLFRQKLAAKPDMSPMPDLVAFALFSTRRQEEITRIEWRDFEPENKRVLVRDMKNPGDKIGNNVWCDLPEPAIKIIERQPRKSDRIFPYTTDALSSNFTRACKFLMIEDLHFHDLRHEGVSRLFEMGLNIPHVAAVSGHRSWQSLKRYTHIRASGDKWVWLAEEMSGAGAPPEVA
ncbi:tyrosine-type recombinase/integrase [Rhodoblastus acidophilus]|uniref:Tyrosine-type recombinase/integrase n=1 Tax=Rhodoblastus acidophilus TaxID=1074 RepID=A0A6N8DPF5_RHOAC|nr:site-specific integrase [Rhodoblastus acidophilus]MCW2275157.1 integrase [Rhodoblastus acidophilus]MTV31425.1 tyrosine-type recombinase/integrase [Rhodoblastus acidophilus]